MFIRVRGGKKKHQDYYSVNQFTSVVQWVQRRRDSGPEAHRHTKATTTLFLHRFIKVCHISSFGGPQIDNHDAAGVKGVRCRVVEREQRGLQEVCQK